MKPVLYVGLKGHMGHMPWGKVSENNLILVTSEKGSIFRKQVYGRSVDGIATHARGYDIVAKFPDLNIARAALDRASVAHDAYCVVIARAEEELRKLQATQRDAVKTTISDFTLP